MDEKKDEPVILQLYGDLCMAVGHTDAAIRAYEKNIGQFGVEYPSSYYTLGKIYESRGCVDKAAEIWRKAIDRFTQAQYSTYLQTLLKSPTVTSAQLLEEHKKWADRFSYRGAGESGHSFEPYDGQRKIRVGYACPFFTSSTIKNQLLPIIRAHDRSKFEIFLYWTDPWPPMQHPIEDVERVKAHADVFRDVGQLADRDYVRQLRTDRIDILVETAGFSPGHRFSAMAARCAPVQISYLNHTGTCGIPNVDYVIADAIALRKEEDSFYTERVYRLPGSFFCFNFEAKDDSHEQGAPPCTNNGFITFGSFGSGAKCNATLIKWWCEIMHQVPGSRILIRNNELSLEDNRRYMQKQFVQHGIAEDRLRIIKGASQKEIVANHRHVDISLDTWPYCGGNTLAESLWYGVPVISYYGRRFSSTYGGSLLHASGCDQLLARSADEYIGKAVALANDRQAIADYRRNLRKMTKEYGFNDARVFAEKIETAYKTMIVDAFKNGSPGSSYRVAEERLPETLPEIISASAKIKLLTICMMARNDNYCGNFLYRLKTSLDYIASGIKKHALGRLIEILVVDWNSDRKLGEDLQLSPEASRITEFIHVPPEKAAALNPPGKAFNTALSQNVAIRRASGRFLMFMPSDILFPAGGLKSLCALLHQGCNDHFELNHTLMLIGRKFIPWQFIEQEPDMDAIEKFLTYNSWRCSDPPYLPGLNAHMGAVLMSRELWHKAQGVDESLTKWGWSDIEVGLRINQAYPTVVLNHYGIHCYEMDSPPQMRATNVIDQNPQKISRKITANNENWGIADRQFKTYTIKSTPSRITKKKKLPVCRRDLLATLSKAPRIEKLLHVLGAHKLRGTEWPAIYLLSSVINKIQPQYYVDFGAPYTIGSYVVPATNPAVYYFAVNNDPNGARLGGFLETLRDKFDYRGHYHLVGGDPETAVSRLMGSIRIADQLDMVYYLPDIFPATYLEQFDRLVGYLSMNGVIILTTKSEKTYADLTNFIDVAHPESIAVGSYKYRALLYMRSPNDSKLNVMEREREEQYLNGIFEAWDHALKCPN